MGSCLAAAMPLGPPPMMAMDLMLKRSAVDASGGTWPYMLPGGALSESLTECIN